MKINLLGGDNRHICLVEGSPPKEKWIRHYPTRFQDSTVLQLTKTLHDDNDRKVDKRSCGALLTFVNRLLLMACKETICIEFQILQDPHQIPEQKENSIINVTVTSGLLRNIHCLLHCGDTEESLKLIFSVILPTSEGAFECFNLQPKKVTCPDSGIYSFDHSTYQQAGIRVPAKFFKVHHSENVDTNHHNGEANPWSVAVKLDLEVNGEDFIPREGVLPDVFDFTRNIFNDKHSCDVTIVTKDGSHVPCHKIFLTGHSDVFRAMFSGDCTESRTNRVEIKDMSENGVRALLQFLYFQSLTQPKSSADIALELFQAAHKYNIVSLSKAMELLLLGKPNEWFDLDMALKMFLFARQLEKGNELKEKVMDILATKTDVVHKSEVLLKNGAFTKELCLELFSLCLNKCQQLEEKLDEKRSPTSM